MTRSEKSERKRSEGWEDVSKIIRTELISRHHDDPLAPPPRLLCFPYLMTTFRIYYTQLIIASLLTSHMCTSTPHRVYSPPYTPLCVHHNVYTVSCVHNTLNHVYASLCVYFTMFAFDWVYTVMG